MCWVRLSGARGGWGKVGEGETICGHDMGPSAEAGAGGGGAGGA